MLNLPRRQTAPISSPYERLGLTDLPFPSEPLLDPYSNDPRRNGSIYAQSPVKDDSLVTRGFRIGTGE